MDNSRLVKLTFVLAAVLVFPSAAFGQEDSLVYLRPAGSELRIEAAGFGITLGNKGPAERKTGQRKPYVLQVRGILRLWAHSSF